MLNDLRSGRTGQTLYERDAGESLARARDDWNLFVGSVLNRSYYGAGIIPGITYEQAVSAWEAIGNLTNMRMLHTPFRHPWWLVKNYPAERRDDGEIRFTGIEFIVASRFLNRPDRFPFSVYYDTVFAYAERTIRPGAPDVYTGEFFLGSVPNVAIAPDGLNFQDWHVLIEERRAGIPLYRFTGTREEVLVAMMQDADLLAYLRRLSDTPEADDAVLVGAFFDRFIGRNIPKNAGFDSFGNLDQASIFQGRENREYPLFVSE